MVLNQRQRLTAASDSEPYQVKHIEVQNIEQNIECPPQLTPPPNQNRDIKNKLRSGCDTGNVIEEIKSEINNSLECYSDISHS
jgi:hypothetical protein